MDEIVMDDAVEDALIRTPELFAERTDAEREAIAKKVELEHEQMMASLAQHVKMVARTRAEQGA